MTATPSKWPGARGALEALRERGRRRGRRWRSPPGTSRPASGAKHDRDAGLLQEAQVAGLVARVRLEVLVTAELRRVDEGGGGDARAARPGRLDEAQVPGVQRAHGGHEAERPRERAQRRPRLGDGAGDDHGWPPAQWPPAAGAAPSGPVGPAAPPPASPAPSSSRRVSHLLVVEPRRGQRERLQAEGAVRPRQPRALAIEQAQVRAHGADVAARDRPRERERRLTALQQVAHGRLEEHGEVVEAARLAGGLVHEALGLALERHQQVAAHDGGEVIQRLLLVGQTERAHAETAGELLAELQVAFLERRDGAGDASQQLRARLAGERLQRVQAEHAHALLVQGLEQVHGAEAAGVQGERLRRAGAADGRQRLRQPAGHRVDLVVRHREPPGVRLERGVAHAHVGHGAEEAGVVVPVDADRADGELGLLQAREDGRSQASGTDHAEAIRVEGQASDLSGCGPPGGGGTAPAVGLCSTGGVPVACRGSAPGH